MVKKTKSRKKLQHKVKKRSKKSKKKWIDDPNSNVDDYTFNFDKNFFLDFEFTKKVRSRHKFKIYKRNLSVKYIDKTIIFNLAKCEVCDLEVKAIKRDNYRPSKYIYFSKKLQKLNCNELVIKNIIE